MFSSGVARVASLGEGVQKWCDQVKEGAKGCGQEEGCQKRYGVQRVTMEFTRSRVL